MLPAIPAISHAQTTQADLLISEYVEGTGFNKAIELYNSSNTTLDLTAYTVEMYANGAVAPTHKLTLSGNLKSNETLVLFHKDAVAELKSKGNVEASNVMNFNGDDALVLKKSGEVIDSFGQVGARSNWGTDVTLVRKPTVAVGDTVPTDDFNRDSEWIVYPKDTFDHLGTHTQGTENPGEPTDPETPVESSTIGDVRAMELGKTVTIKGIVTANLTNTISVQDETGAIAVRPTSIQANVGDEVTLTGTLADFRGLLQVDNAKLIKKTENVGERTANVITGNEIGETNESKLVTVHNVVLSDVDAGAGWANYVATDGTEFLIRDETASLGLTVGTTYDSVTGIVQQFDATYQLLPRSPKDIVADRTVAQPVVANPNSGTFVGSTTVTLDTASANAEILFTLDETDPIVNGATYADPIVINEDTILKAVVKTIDGKYSDVKTFTYTITESLRIHDIQGEGHTSPFVNKTVEGVEGIVTYSYAIQGSTYYHIQTPDTKKDGNPNTSEAIVLYSGKDTWKLAVGDLVSVNGSVSEYAIDGFSDRQETDLKTTQINIREDRGGVVKILERNVALPTPFTINESNLTQTKIMSEQAGEFNPELYSADFWESREAMLVQVGNVKAVGPQTNGDLVTVLENAKTDTENGGILLKKDDANANRVQFRLEPNGPARSFEVATGDSFKGPITGVVGYSFQNYKIYASLDEMKAAHSKGSATPAKTTITKVDSKLTIAAYNLENFSNNSKTTSADKAQKLARAFAVDMQSPDIIGVTEVQDNTGPDAGGPEANQSYERLIAAIELAGGVKYEFVNIDPVNNADGGQPNANIRVGFLYNPARVKLTAGNAHGDATTAVGYENNKLTVNPGRIDPTNPAFNSSRKPLAAQFDFQGENVIVIANHWNSKNGDTPLYGAVQPPVNGSEVQRRKIAQIMYDFITDVKTKNPEANIVSLGDFNDFQFSDSLKIHEGNLMTNMVNKVPEESRYSYVYQGNSQVLDHVLVSNNLANQTEIDMLHINADFTDMAGRASDHDPVLVQIALGKPFVWQNAPVKKFYFLVNVKKKELIVTEPGVSITMDSRTKYTNGITLQSQYALLTGFGFKTNQLILQPTKKGQTIETRLTLLHDVVVDGPNKLRIYGAENIKKIQYINGASLDTIEFYSKWGKRVSGPGEKVWPFSFAEMAS